jgi:hypothetical protein
MKVTVTDNYLNMRTGAPLLSAPNTQYLSPGDVIEIEEWLYRGDLYSGVDTWIKDLAGNFYWSGGVSGTDALKISDQVFCESLPAVPDHTYDEVVAAITENRDQLQTDFPNIVYVYPAIRPEDGEACVDICIQDEQQDGLSEAQPFKDLHIPVRIICNFKAASPQLGKSSKIANANSQNELGTACLALSAADDANTYLLTCNHVLTGGVVASPGNTGSRVGIDDFGTFEEIGSWTSGIMSTAMDAALVKLDAGQNPEPNQINLPVYGATERDASKTMVTIAGGFTNMAPAYIIHVNQPADVIYDDGTKVTMTGLITLSTTTNPSNFTAATQKGDSGALVFHAQTYQPIAMVVGANDQFTFALPVTQVLKAFPKVNLSINN